MKKLPTLRQTRKMPAEKRRYWEDRIARKSEPSFYNSLRVIQYMAARVEAKMPNPLTRQVRRSQERAYGARILADRKAKSENPALVRGA